MIQKIAKAVPYTVIRTFESKSRPGVQYQVRVGGDKKLYCTCPGWRYAKAGHKGCCHVKAVAPNYKYESDVRFELETAEPAQNSSVAQQS